MEMEGDCGLYQSCWSCLKANCTWVQDSGNHTYNFCSMPSDTFRLVVGNWDKIIGPFNASCSNAEDTWVKNRTKVTHSFSESSHQEREAYLEEFMIIFGAILLIFTLLLFAGLMYWGFQALENGNRSGLLPPIRFKLLLMSKEDRRPIIPVAKKSVDEVPC